MFYKSSSNITIVKNTSKIGVYLTIKLKILNFLSKFFKSDSPIKKVLIDVLFFKSKSSSFVLIPLSEIRGPW